MRQEYQYRTRDVITVGHNYKIYGQRVKPGWILLVLTCFLHMPNAKIGDVGEILIEDGGLELEIMSRGRDAAKQGISSLNPFYVGEYRRILGHAPDSDVGDEICLTVIGEMVPLKNWRKGKV